MDNKILMIIAGVLLLGGVVFMYMNSSGKTSEIQTGENSDPAIAGAAAYPNVGAIDFKSTPTGANIYVDGAYKGITPKTVRPVSVGSHSVKLTLNGYLPYASTTSVRKGVTSVVYVTLVPNVTISPSPIPTISPSPSIPPSPTPNATITPTPTVNATPIPNATITPTPTLNATATPNPTVNATATPTPTITPTPTPNFCTDTDGGQNFFEFGITSNSTLTLNDTCFNLSILREGYCIGNSLLITTANCTSMNGSTCVSGRCLV